MIRINLLPPEIVQKRIDEKRWRWIAFAAIGVFALVGIVYGIMQVQVSMRETEVASIKQQADGLQQEAQRFQVFQVKQADLEKRQSIANAAIAGRIDWSSLCSDVALILPSDIYLMRLSGTEPKAATVAAPQASPGTLSLDGRAIDYPFDVPDLGYKSVAKFLVRLADLASLTDVWLGSATKPPKASADSTATSYITFVVTSEIPGESTATVSPGVPAPPTP